MADTAKPQGSKAMDNVRKSSRLRQHAKFAKHMNEIISKSKKLQKRRSSDDEVGTAPVIPEKVVKKEVVQTPKPVAVKAKPASPKKKPPSTPTKEKDEDDDAETEDDGNHTDQSDQLSPDSKIFANMLELHRVGDEPPKNDKQPIALNRRGTPQRIRKLNRLFFDEDNIVNLPVMKQRVKREGVVKKEEKRTPKPKVRPADRREELVEPKYMTPEDAKEAKGVRQKIGITLRNLLKLPKAQRWVFYEWFYSNIDSALFLGSNDFLLCLRETFGNLKTTMMTRTEWCVARRIMGKPRRCSQAFFNEERITLEKRRNVIRMIQQRKLRDFSLSKDLPDKIPLQLGINARVTARLRHPQAGLFTGKVQAVDPSNNTYRITFDRMGLGTHSVPDYEVLLDGEPDVLSLSSLQKRFYSSKTTIPPGRPLKITDGKFDMRSTWAENTTANFPKNFYEMVVRICKIIKEKRSKVDKLKELNEEAEKMASLGVDYSAKYQREYASIIIDLESLNISLERFLTSVQKCCHELAPEACRLHMLMPSFLREKSVKEAKDLVNNYVKDNPALKDHKLLDLVIEFVSLMIQVQTLSNSKQNAHEIQVLKQTMSSIKSMISPNNLSVFQNKVEVHIQYIESTLGSGGNLSSLLGQVAAK